MGKVTRGIETPAMAVGANNALGWHAFLPPKSPGRGSHRRLKVVVEHRDVLMRPVSAHPSVT